MSESNNRLRKVRSIAAYAVEDREPRQIILEIQGDTLTFRQFGSRQRFSLPIDRAMQEAMIETAAKASPAKDDLFASK